MEKRPGYGRLARAEALRVSMTPQRPVGLMLLAGRERCLEHSLNVAQFFHPRRHLLQSVLDAPLDSAAGRRLKKLGHVIQGEPRGLRSSDEPDPVDILFAVQPVVIGATRRSPE